MKRIAKKTVDVKRSKAAKKGWATRRRNEREAKRNAKKSNYEREMRELGKKLQRSQAKERAAIRKASKLQRTLKEKEREYSSEALKRAAHEAGEKMSTADVLGLMTADERRQAQKDIINARMDRALRLYGDVRYDAFVLAEELDMDIGDIYDAWDYEEGSAG
jgi:SOS-response transcriptional repressor LexA